MTDARVAMISGAGRGIGAEIAAALARAGWRLSLGARNPAQLIPPEGADALAHRFDARDPDSERLWVEATAERFGRIDAVIANAGIMIPKTVIAADDADLDDLIQVNVKSPLRLVRAAWPHLVASGHGRVVTIASLSGKRVKSATSGLYAVSKFAALALTHAIRHAGWDEGVRATAVCPGFVATDMAAGLTNRPPEAMTQPQDVARIVAFLLDLPDTASIAEIPINSTLEDSW
ncbi:SDR family NAD(P)-dependent oxidoreductase [Inquilinus limosus]|uniref:SDR family NAD(P)-dependent oxidoreductase n=1 Tax=Inquilinus limosus TaxID=171674 RepID=UPI000479EC7A|nr:SDR family NAD(P)-dependent oxidoreductase [Inquilinus limosus]